MSEIQELINKVNIIDDSFDSVRTPSLKLFMSFDLIGSTAFKHSHSAKTNYTETWYGFFKTFYTEISNYLVKSYSKLDSIEDINLETIQDEQELENFVLPYLWKNLGDEIIYIANIENTKHIVYHIEAMQKALIMHNNKVDSELKIQGTAWLSGFPIINAIIFDDDHVNDNDYNIKTSQKEMESNKQIDFIGPTIDLGFRISKFSTERKFVLSVPLVYMLLKEIEKDKSNRNINAGFENIFTFYFDGLKDTKGIDNGNYPIIWIDNHNGNDELEELYGVKKEKCVKETLLSYLEFYIKESSDNISFPFVYKQVCAAIEKNEHIEESTKKSFIKFCELYIKIVTKVYGRKGKEPIQKLTNNSTDTAKINEISLSIQNHSKSNSLF